LVVPAKELAARKRAWKAPKPYTTSGVLGKYAASVSSASLGAVTSPLVAATQSTKATKATKAKKAKKAVRKPR